MHKKIHLLTLPYLLAAAFLVNSLGLSNHTPVAKAAFGISPPWVKNDHVLPGTEFTQTITLSTNNPAEDMIVKTSIDGDREIKKWVTIENAENLIMEKGQSQFPMKVNVDIPNRAGLKRYTGSIDIRLEPLVKSNSGGVAIALGANAEIDLNVVGDEVVNYKISSAKIEPTVVGDPINVALNVENLGNIELSTIDVEMEIWNQNETERITTIRGNELSGIVEPYNQNTVTLDLMPENLSPGQYWAKVKAFRDETAIFESKIFLAVDPPAVSPSIPADQTQEGEEMTESKKAEAEAKEAKSAETEKTEASETLKPAAAESGSNLVLILGIVGIAFGLIALIGMFAIVMMLLKRDQGGHQNPPTPPAPPSNPSV